MFEQVTVGFSFGPFFLDLSKEELYRDKAKLQLGRKSFKLLRYFLRHPRKVVPHDELLEAGWGKINVSSNNLPQQISNLRKILGADERGQEYIENVRNEGYRFAALPIPKIKRPLGLWVSVAAALLVVVAAVIGYSRLRVTSAETTKRAGQFASAFYLGLTQLESGEVLKAKTTFEHEVGREPNYGPARAALSAALFTLGYEKSAKDESEKAVRLLAGLNREETLWVNGQHAEAILDWQNASRIYETLHSLAPEQREWALRYAIALAKNGMQKDAYDVIARLRRADGEDKPPPQTDLAEAQVAEHDNDYKRECYLAQRAEKTARSNGCLYQVGHAELSQAWALDSLSRPATAEPKALDAKSVLNGIGDQGGVGHAWKLLGDVYGDEGRLEMANSAYQNAETIFHKIGRLSGEAVALNNRAYVLRDLGDLAGASDLFERSLKISRSLHDLDRQAMALIGVAIVLKRQGNFKGAEVAYTAATEIAIQLSDDKRHALYLNNFAIVLEDQGRLGEAKVKLNAALALFTQLNRQADIAMAFGNLGEVELRSAHIEDAEADYKNQLRIAGDIRSQDLEAYALLGLGQVSFFRSDLKAARNYLNKSLQIRQSLHQTSTAAESLVALAELDLEEKDFQAAAERMKVASLQFEREKQRDQEMVAESILGESLVEGGKPTEGLAVANFALDLMHRSVDNDSRNNANLHLWRVFYLVDRRNEALKELLSVATSPENRECALQSMLARAYIAQLNLQIADPNAASELAQLRSECQRKGLKLITRRASAECRLASSRNKQLARF